MLRLRQRSESGHKEICSHKAAILVNLSVQRYAESACNEQRVFNINCSVTLQMTLYVHSRSVKKTVDVDPVRVTV